MISEDYICDDKNVDSTLCDLTESARHDTAISLLFVVEQKRLSDPTTTTTPLPGVNEHEMLFPAGCV